MKVAVPVDSATGRKVRALTSGSISSIANMTPPIGVLKVAAMPAPAPAATRVMRCHGSIRMSWPSVEPMDGADLDDRAFAANRAAGADRRGGGQRFHQRHLRADDALAIEDCVHHLGHAMALGLWREVGDEKGDDQAADHGHEDHQPAPGLGRGEFVGVVNEREMAEEHRVVNHRDQRAEHDRAEAGDDAHHYREQAKCKQADGTETDNGVEVGHASEGFIVSCGRAEVAISAFLANANYPTC